MSGGDCQDWCFCQPGYVMTDSTIRTAVAAWLADATAAEATYGHISTWETGGVTDMSELFKDASSFNEDIGAWDTSGVTTMYGMFYGASSFNQPLSCWRVDNVKNFWLFVVSATSFDQDLGWCVDDDVSLSEGMGAVWQSACESTYCGIKQSCAGQYCDTRTQVADCPATTSEGGGCVPTLAPTRRSSTTVAPGASSSSGSSGGSGGAGMGPIIGGAVGAAVLLLAVGALCFYRHRKGSEAKPSGVDSPPPPKLVPLKARPEEEATVLSVAPEAEETLPAQLPPPPAKGWFATEPEGEPMAPEHESASFAPEAEEPPPPGSWFSGATPEPEAEFEPEPEA